MSREGAGLVYHFGVGLGFLATVRRDGGPRVHPMCPLLADEHLWCFIVPSPKQSDLRRDGRYALHSETCPPPREEDGFAIIGLAAEVTDPAVRAAVREQVLAERDGNTWPSFDADVLFELRIERCLLMLTQSDGTFPRGPTRWRVKVTG